MALGTMYPGESPDPWFSWVRVFDAVPDVVAITKSPKSQKVITQIQITIGFIFLSSMKCLPEAITRYVPQKNTMPFQ
jgi:hypothetical protein